MRGSQGNANANNVVEAAATAALMSSTSIIQDVYHVELELPKCYHGATVTPENGFSYKKTSMDCRIHALQ